MTFTQQQITAVRHAFFLAGYDGELRTIPDQSDGVIVFVTGQQPAAGDPRSLEIVLIELLGRRVMVTEDIGSPSQTREWPMTPSNSTSTTDESGA